jgi:DedD protein
VTATPDLAIDALKRRARRRLIGAIILALAAAVILPLLLESEPKPLGDDVSIQIPPIDNGKFVNPLSSKGTEAKAKAPGKTEPQSSALPPPSEPAAVAVPAPLPDVATSEQRAPASAPPADARQVPAAPAGDTKADAVAAAQASAPQPAAAPPTAAKAEPDKAPAGTIVIQLAAFADVKAANGLAAKLKKAGFPGYIEPLKTKQGTVQRVRVGPYASRADADAALAKLKAAGYSGAIATAR